MNFECQICLELFTSPGTSHAPFSAPCGHVIGKSCIEKLEEYKCKDEFNCPFCSKKIKFKNFHPIYLMGDEIPNINSNVSTEILCKNTNQSKDKQRKNNQDMVKSISLINIRNSYHNTDFFNSMIYEGKILNELKNNLLVKISNYPFYFGKFTRKDCENYLNFKGTKGDYLLRDSETNMGDFTISLKGINKNRHYLIRFDIQSYNCIIGRRIFQSFESLIDYFKLHPIYISEETNEKLFLIKPLFKNIT